MGSSCPICFDDLNDKIKASPDVCDHVFCFLCLKKWSKHGSYCPVDRKRYKKIINLDSEKLIQIKPLKRKRNRVVYDFSSNCEVCSKNDKPDILLLCDCCDLAFHCSCLSPPLETVPAGLWFCPTCVSVEEKLKKSKGITKEDDIGIFHYNLTCQSETDKIPESESVSSSFKAPGNIFDTCNELISVFEEINILNSSVRNIQSDANASNSNIETENILKSFDYTSEITEKEKLCTKSFKTYIKNIKRNNSELDVDFNQCIKKKKNFDVNLDHEKCLDNNVSCNSNSLNNEIGIVCYDDNSNINNKNHKHNLESGIDVNEHKLNESNVQNLKTNKKVIKNMSLNRRNMIIFGMNECDQINKEKVQNYNYENSNDFDRNIHENFLSSTENVAVNREESNHLDTSKAYLLPSCSSSFKKLDEGTFFDSFSNAFVKDPYNDATSVFRFDFEDASAKHQEKNYLSVFGQTEDIGASQKKLTEIKPYAGIPLYLTENFSHCKNMLSFISHLCEICKLKFLKRYPTVKHEVCLSCAQLSKSSNIFNKPCKNNNYQLQQLECKKDSKVFSAWLSSCPQLVTKSNFIFSKYIAHEKDTKLNSTLSDNSYSISPRRNFLYNEQHIFKISNSIKRRQNSLYRDMKKVAKDLKTFPNSLQKEPLKSNFYCLGNEKHPLKRTNISSIEKRQHALLHEFKKIHAANS